MQEILANLKWAYTSLKEVAEREHVSVTMILVDAFRAVLAQARIEFQELIAEGHN